MNIESHHTIDMTEKDRPLVVLAAIDDRDVSGTQCISCGEQPRPKRENWDEVRQAAASTFGGLTTSTHHHRCGDCRKAASRDVGR